MIDHLSPVGPVFVNTLLVPAGKIRTGKFADLVSRLQKERIVRLGDVNLFSPLAFPDGRVFFSLVLSETRPLSVETFPFELNREAQVVVYVVDASEFDEKVEDELRAIQDAVLAAQSQYRHAILHQVLVLGGEPSTEKNDRLLWTPDLPNFHSTTVKTLMCDLTARLLHSMQDLVTEIHDLPTIEAPLETSQQRHASLDIAARVHARMSMAAPSRPSSSLARRTSQKSPIRHSAASPSSVGREESRDRSSTAEIKRTRSTARTRIVLGALSLQAGLWPDAVRDLSEGTAKAKHNNDHIWHAKGLEYIVTCLFMFGWARMSFQIPQICYPTSEAAGASFEGGKNRDLSLHYLTKLLPDLLDVVHGLYSKGFAQTQDAFPQFLMSECILRRGFVLSTLSGNGKIDGQVLNRLLAFESVAAGIGPSRAKICALLIEAIPEIPQVMPLSDLLQILIGLASLLSSIGMSRKQAFVLGDLLQRITPGLIEARKVGAAEVGMHPAASLLSLRAGSQAGYLRIEEGMRTLLTYVGSLYGQGFGGSFDLQIETLKSCAAICEALPDFQGVLDYSGIILQAAKTETFAPRLSIEDQTKILAGLKRAVAAATRLGIDVKANYWDDLLVRGIEARPSSTASRLVKQAKQSTTKNPFIYNPYEKTTETEQVLVAGEMAYFTVCLQNPFEFEVEVENISLVTEGDFSSSQHSIVLGSLSCQNFSLAGTPQSAGTLAITGCRATIKYCKEKTYNLWDPIPKTEDPKKVSWTVLGRQPVVSLQSTALSQPSLMVLEGETRSFNITLQNHSDVDANLFRFSFHDSATTQLQEALTQDLLPVDRYELEHQLSRNPVTLTAGPESIAAGETGVFTIEVFGTPGLLEATIQINYAHVEDGQELYTRQLSFRVAVTVNAGVEVLRSNLHANPQSVSKSAIEQTDDRCLLLLDLRNVWPFPLLITVQVRDTTGSWSHAQTESLLPGHVSRMILLVPRLFIADPQASIPLHDQRQFVVSAAKVPPETERASREAFWYREELLKHIKASWKEDGREGTVVLRRGIRLSPRMVETLRLEDVEIVVKLQSWPRGRTQLQTQSFAWLIVQVYNRSSTPLHLSVRIQPSLRDQPHNIALDLSKRFAWTGMLQKVLHPPLGPSESRETKLGIMALCAGDYEIGATVEELRGANPDKNLDRRIWHSREPCPLDVVDQLS